MAPTDGNARLLSLTQVECCPTRTKYDRPAFPAHSLDSYLPRLVRAGKRVAICEALQSASPQQSSSKPGSALGSHDCCDGLPEQQPEKKSRKRSTKKAENK